MADKRISQLVDRGTVVNSDVVPIVVSGAVTTNKATISSIQTFMQGNLDLGVTSVGITFGTSGTDINASGSPVTSSGNITINLPTASATNRGALSSADWITFNSKQPAGNYVTLDTVQTITAQKTFAGSGSSDTVIISHGSGAGFALDVIKAGNGETLRVTKTSGSGNAMTVIGGNFEAPTIVKTGGTSSQFLKADGSIDSTAYTTNTGTVTSVGLSSATSGVTIGSTPITTSGTITLAIATASGSQNGLLSSTDWTTFNGKQAALNGTGFVKISGTTISYDNSTYLTTSSAASTYLPLAGGTLTGALNGTSANFSGSVGIGTNTPEGSGLTVASGGILVSLDPGANRKVLELYATSTGAKVSSSYVGASSYGNLELLTSGLARLTIADTGAATFTNKVTARNGTSGVAFETTNAVDADFSIETVAGGTTKIGTSGNKLGINVGGGNVGIGTASPGSLVAIEKSSNSGSGSAFPRLAIKNTLATQGDGSSTFNFADILVSSGNESVNMFLATTFAAGTWAPAGIINVSTNHDFQIKTNNTERMRITSDGYARLSASSGGIQFNGDTAAANALDDYEEGTHSPNATPAGGGSFTTLTQSGSYVKIGQMVNYSFIINIDSVGTAVGDVIISLPFVCGLTPIRPMGSGRENALTGNTLQVRTVSDGSAGALVMGGGTLLNSWQALCTITYRTTA